MRILSPSLVTLHYLIGVHKRMDRAGKVARIANKLRGLQNEERSEGFADVGDIPWSDEVSSVNSKASRAAVARANRDLVSAITHSTVEFTARDLYNEASLRTRFDLNGCYVPVVVLLRALTRAYRRRGLFSASRRAMPSGGSRRGK